MRLLLVLGFSYSPSSSDGATVMAVVVLSALTIAVVLLVGDWRRFQSHHDDP